jgi:hypothetical protein
MRLTLVIVTVLGLAACGGKSQPAAPATSSPPAAEPAAAGEGEAERCCCELPADPPVYEMHGSDECHTDQHGVCVDADKCG